MTMRLSLRIGLIITLALALVLAALLAAFLFARRDVRFFGVVLPTPGQTAAIVRLIENTPEAQWPLALDALSTPGLRVDVVDMPPASRGVRNMPGLTMALRTYLAAMGGRPVSAMVELERNSQGPRVLISGSELRASRPVRILIGLRNGKTLMIEARNGAADRVTGIRLALLVLLVTLVIGSGCLWIVHQQLKPLERLAQAVVKFGTRLETSTLPEEGTIELRQLIGAFNRLQADIGALITGRTRMIAAIGHDIGTYLTRLRLRADYIADKDQRERAARDIEDMHRLVEDTLQLARLQHDGEKAEALDVVPVLRRQVADFAEGGKPVTLGAAVPSALVRITANGLERAAGNLISNALKYGGEARVGVILAEGRAEVRVEDRGPGIPPEERAAVLEPFYRRDAARNLDERGFGLGLAIVSDIVKRAGGSLAFEDREGGGLRVRLLLPLAADDGGMDRLP